MKSIFLALSLVFVGTLASAGPQTFRVCSVGRHGQIYKTIWEIDGKKAVMNQDGTYIYYDVLSAKGADLKRTEAILSKDAGKKIYVVEATQYTMEHQHGTTRFQLAIDSHYYEYMIFTDTGIVGAKSSNCD